MCVVNGRLGLNDFTHVSHRECSTSVIDYVIVTHEQLSVSTNFSIHRMSEVINDLNLHGCDNISDHSVLVYEVALCNNVEESMSEQDSTSSFKRYRLNEIPGSFFNCEASFSRVMHSINRPEKSLAEDADVNVAYHEFVSLIISEMAEKLKVLVSILKNVGKK